MSLYVAHSITHAFKHVHTYVFTGPAKIFECCITLRLTLTYVRTYLNAYDQVDVTLTD